MTLENLFAVGNLTAMVGWGLLIFLPRWRGVAQLVAGLVIPALLAAAYAALVGVWWSRSAGGFGSLDEVFALFQTRGMLLAGWFHYLAFDLLIGAKVARDARRDGVPHLVVVPLLILTFLFGPMGYLAALVVRLAWRGPGGTALGRRLIATGRWWTRPDPTLMRVAVICLAATLPTLTAAILDARTFGDQSTWIKPLKFEVSTGVYLATLALFLPLAGERFRLGLPGRVVAWAAIASGLFEVVYIAWRASRGEASHFNMAEPVARVLWALMGVGALILSGVGLIVAWGVALSDAGAVRPAARLGIVLGLVLTFGFALVSGAVMAVGNSHFVGQAPAPHAVMPLVGWSRAIGDLRVAHFLGLHAQQVIAVAGFAVAAWAGQRGRAVVGGFAAVYAVVTAALFVQAITGRPVLPV